MLANRQDGTYFIKDQEAYDALFVTVAQVKKQLNISHSEDDDLIELLIGAAQDMFQSETGLFVNRQPIAYKCATWPTDEFCITRGPWPDTEPINGGMSYYNSDDDIVICTDCSFYVSNNTLRIRMGSRPNLYDRGDAIYIEYDCGWETIPKAVIHAVILIAAHLYNNRDIVIVGASVSEQLPFTLQALINQFKVRVI